MDAVIVFRLDPGNDTNPTVAVVSCPDTDVSVETLGNCWRSLVHYAQKNEDRPHMRSGQKVRGLPSGWYFIAAFCLEQWEKLTGLTVPAEGEFYQLDPGQLHYHLVAEVPLQ